MCIDVFDVANGVCLSIKIINRFGDDRKKNIPNMHRSMEIEAGVVLRYLK